MWRQRIAKPPQRISLLTVPLDSEKEYSDDAALEPTTDAEPEAATEDELTNKEEAAAATISLDAATENCDDPPLVHGEDDPVEAKTEDKIAALGPVVVSQVPHSGKKAASQ